MSRNAVTLNVRIPAHARFGRTVRQQITSFAEKLRIHGEELDEFIFALGEALANAIEHGRGGDVIEVRCEFENDKVLATVTDSGAGFKPESLATVALPPNFSERGRGLPIMRRCTDIFAVHSVPGRGTAVVLGRYLPGTEETAMAS
jgi:anti-sigma regulatory factor (Ser/Thr protein kinase)